MKKIYILTYHCASNVGAMLQCYALSTTIERLGYDPVVIDFRPSKVISPSVDLLFWKKKSAKETVKDYIRYCIRILKNGWNMKKHFLIFKGNTDSAFCDFMTKKLHLSDRTYYHYSELSSFSHTKGIFIVGSDQVWNPLLSDVPKAYLLDFVKEGYKNSYAASFGSCMVNNDFAHQLRNSLSDFHNISVREDSGIEIVKTAADKTAVCVMDPVFLLDKYTWNALLYKAPIYDPYIFVYRMEDNELFQKEIDRIKEKDPQLKVVQFDYINGGINADYILQRKGPIDFISYLFSSKYVLTNSFHGTAFSIIAKKDAVVIPHSCYNERIESLMRKISVVKSTDGIFRIQGEKNEIQLKANIEFSLDVLKNICSE